MKKWPVRVVVFYILAVLCQALAFYIGGDVGSAKLGMVHVGVLLLLPSMLIVVGGALLLLTVRVDKLTHYPMTQRQLVIPVAVGVLLSLLLALSLGLSSIAGVWQDDMFENNRMGTMALIVLLVWCVWALLFYRYFRARGYEKGIRRMFNVLLAGSVLELLIAVTSHMIIRQRTNCSSLALNFWGLLMGLSIMFIAFGPGIIFLYKDRLTRAQKQTVLAK